MNLVIETGQKMAKTKIVQKNAHMWHSQAKGC